MTELLISEPPLQVLPGLAAAIGLNEAIAAQQLHYWSRRSKDEGWVHNTMEEWREQFPFWSQPTIERTWRSLRKQGLVEVEQRGGNDRTNHYRLVRDAFPEGAFPSHQSDGIKPSNGRVPSHQNDGMSNNNTETTSENPPTPRRGKREKSTGKKVNRKAVTQAELALATDVLAAFNEVAGTSYTIDSHFRGIVGRIRQRPDLTAEQHQAAIASAFADPWWGQSHPSPAVIYGNGAIFEKTVEETRKGGKKKPRGADALRKMAERDQ